LDKKPSIIYKVENLGNFTAKVLYRHIKMGYLHSISEAETAKNFKRIDIPIYVSKEAPFNENLFFDDVLTKPYYDAVIGGVLKIFVVGKVEYTNEVSNEKWIFDFIIEIKPPPFKDFIVRRANNTQIR
jgi:hypothetical protein